MNAFDPDVVELFRGRLQDELVSSFGGDVVGLGGILSITDVYFGAMPVMVTDADYN